IGLASRTDLARLKSVLTNIRSNSIKYAPRCDCLLVRFLYLYLSSSAILLDKSVFSSGKSDMSRTWQISIERFAPSLSSKNSKKPLAKTRTGLGNVAKADGLDAGDAVIRA